MKVENSYLFEQYPICPYCGYKEHDWWEWGDDITDGNQIEYTCEMCGKEISIDVSIDVTFCTKKNCVDCTSYNTNSTKCQTCYNSDQWTAKEPPNDIRT